MASGVNRAVNTSAVGVKYLHFRVTGTSTTRTLAEGSSDASIAAHASDGTYVITLNEASRRTPVIVGLYSVTIGFLTPSINSDNKTITVLAKAVDGTTAQNTSFHMTVAVFNTPDAN